VPSPRDMADELFRRRNPKRPPPFDLARALFGKQLPFGLDEARFQTACCTRRSGKTVGLLAKLLKKAESTPNSVCLYITLSRINAKRLAWDILKSLNSEHGIGGVANESELLLTLPNGARIYLTGCADMGEVEKFRGLALAIVVIDEAQSFPTLMLQRLIDEVLMPALMDFAGLLVLVGTPGPVPVGYFHSACHSAEWAHHSWTVFDNPHIERKSGQTPQQLLEAELKRRGVTVNDPVIQREWFRQWVSDPNSLVFSFDASINTRPAREHQHHVIGIDVGFNDADAIDVLGWSDHVREVDLVFEDVCAKQHIDALAAKVVKVYEKYQPLAVVMDTGGGGKKLAESIGARHRISIAAADKLRKNEHIEWVNSALRTRQLFVPPDSRFAQEALLLEWDRSNPEKPKISDRFHSDTADGLLYAYVEALHWLEEPEKPKAPRPGSPEHIAALEASQQADLDAELEREMAANRTERRNPENEADWY
jgi:hypothetical protein